MSTDYDDATDREPDDDGWQEYKDNELMGEPREEPEEELPVNLDEIEESFSHERLKIRDLSPNCAYIAGALPYVIEELRQARADAERRAASMRHEYAVTDGLEPADDAELVTGEQADLVLKNSRSAAVWGREVYPGAWYQLSGEPPF
ncbi:hypothetical protein AB0J35_57705 [Nonomuraea angiospora]|uniref:hypothetical protein n=1 Tax=Nonomuraea angiospora TaxID=46172 RepID=UPI0034229DB5